MNAHCVRGWRPRGTVRSASYQRLNGTKSGNAKIEKGKKNDDVLVMNFLFQHIEKKIHQIPMYASVGDAAGFFFKW